MKTLAVVLALALGCGGTQVDPDEPQTAAEKQRRDAEKKGEADASGGKWGGWRYKGDRNDCFFVVGRTCYKTEKAACNAARCKTAAACTSTGGGPVTVSCQSEKKTK
jgi:hypothetical protein